MIQKMMAKEPGERFQDLTEVLSIIEKLKRHPDDKSRSSETPKDNSDVKKSFNPLLVVSGATFILIVILVVNLTSNPRSSNNQTSQEENVELTPNELYNQAVRLLEQGNFFKSRQVFEKFFAQNIEAIDPHLKFTLLLKQQEGIEGARSYYSNKSSGAKNPNLHLAHTLVMKKDKQGEAFKILTNNFPDYGPAFYYASLQWNDNLAKQTFREKRQELHYLEKFVKLDEKGQFLKYFLNKQNVEQYRSDAKSRLKILVDAKELHENPVKLKLVTLAAPSNPSVIIGGNSRSKNLQFNVTISESQNEIFFSTDGKEFKSTGFSENINSFTLKKMPNTLIDVNDSVKEIFVKYIDIKGVTCGPYTIKINKDQRLVDSTKNILNVTKTSWIAFRDFDNRLLVYFTHLATYAKALKEIRYSINSDSLDRTWRIDEKNPYNNVYMEVQPSTEKIYVQLKYKDDSKSEIVEFVKPANLRKE